MSVLLSVPANATNIYANSEMAHNINLLSDTFLSYAKNGESLSELFLDKKMYGTMTRVDEYGDDGTTLKISGIGDNDSGYIFKNVWADAKHINGHTHYNNDTTKHTSFSLFTLGATTDSIDLKYGDIYFGAFAGYINGGLDNMDSDGDVGGIFAHYDFQNFGATVLANIGSLNNHRDSLDFNNSWTNIAFDMSAKFNIDKTLLVRPGLYAGYMFVSSADLYIDNKFVESNNFNFFNVAPSVQFIKEIVPNWYGTLSAKYVMRFGGDNDIYIANTTQNGVDFKDYTDIGTDIEYNFKRFAFTGSVHALIGGFDGWSGDLNIKYKF